MADYADFAALKEKVWRAAIDSHMDDQGYEGDSHSGYSWMNTLFLPKVDGPTGTITYQVPRGRGFTLDPWTEIYHPWIEKIDQAFEGWDQLPDPAGFDKLITPLQNTVTRLTFTTGDTQNGGSNTGNKDLVGDFSTMEASLNPHGSDAMTSTAVATFIQRYGPEVLSLVIGNLKQSVIVLGLAQQGEKQLWEKARQDIVTLMVNAEAAFKSAEPATDPFAVCSAFLGMVGAFFPPAAPYTGAAGAALSFVNAVKPPDKGTEVSPDLKGSSADDVYTKLCDSVGKLNSTVTRREDELHTMLTSMFDKMNGDAKDFSLYVKSGLDPEVKKMGTISVDTALMKKIGFSVMPDIAATLSDAAPDLETASSSLPWMRPWNIGYTSTGPWDEYFYLNELVSGAISSNANQIVLAGEALATAAGYLHDSDGLSKDSMTTLHKDLSDSKTGWPKVDDDPPDYVRLPNGKMIPA